MGRKKGLTDYSDQQLFEELARRRADQKFHDGMSMSDIEAAAEKLKSEAGGPSVAAMLAKMKPEKATPKACPKCRKKVPVRALERERTVTSLSGPVTFRRNYHYCERCEHGFYPRDLALGLPEQGELTAEMEKRVLDFAVNDVYGECVARWLLHYQQPISDNLLRRVVARVGEQCETVDHHRLHEELLPTQKKAAEVLVAEYDGSQLPIRGAEPWKEAKVGVVYRYDTERRKPMPDARYTTVVGCLDEFAPLMQDLLEIEGVDEARTVIWLGDGLPSNWSLADQLAPDAVQILDWYHAVENAMACAKVLFGEESPWLREWQQSIEAMLALGDPEVLIRELMDCLPEVPRGRRGSRESLEAIDELVRYYRNNAHRMKYRMFLEAGFPIGSGTVESAHRHVLQVRMKRAGQRWSMHNARLMARLRAAYRTGGPLEFYGAIQRARRRQPLERSARRNRFRWARYGSRDTQRSEKARSN